MGAMRLTTLIAILCLVGCHGTSKNTRMEQPQVSNQFIEELREAYGAFIYAGFPGHNTPFCNTDSLQQYAVMLHPKWESMGVIRTP